MPLTPNERVDIIPADDKVAMTDFTTTVYIAMNCIATSKYDRPTSSDRANWKAVEYTECLVY